MPSKGPHVPTKTIMTTVTPPWWVWNPGFVWKWWVETTGVGNDGFVGGVYKIWSQTNDMLYDWFLFVVIIVFVRFLFHVMMQHHFEIFRAKCLKGAGVHWSDANPRHPENVWVQVFMCPFVPLFPDRFVRRWLNLPRQRVWTGRGHLEDHLIW